MLGDILKETRKNKNLTLSETASLLGVSTGYLSNLEKNRQEPSLAILKEIAVNLDISLSMLLAGEQEEEDVILIKKEERSKVKFRNLTKMCEVLTPLEWRAVQPAEIQVLYMEIPGESKINLGTLSTGEDECIYVEKGQLDYYYGEGKTVVKEGGSIFIPRRTGHSMYNPLKESTYIYWIVKEKTGE